MRTIWETIRKVDILLVMIPLALGVLSVLMIDSITSNYATYPKQVWIQMAAFIIGFVTAVIAIIIDHSFYERFYKVFYALSFVIQLSVYIPGFGMELNGSRAWVNLGVTTMQPSELVKITFVLAVAGYLTKHRNTLVSFKGFLIAFLYAIPVIGLVAYIDMGAGIIMGFMFVGMVFAAGLKMGLFLRLAGVFILSIPIIYRFMADHQKERFAAFLNPENTEIEATYHVMQSKIAIGSGGIFGKGLGNGTIKESGFLPIQESDFIFAIICEELGFVGGAAVITLYGIMIWRIWRIIARSKEVYGSMLSVGFLCMFGFQIFENIGMTMGVMPVTGITLPFLSAGGSSIVANMIAIGMIVGVGVRSKIRTYKYISTN